MVPYVYSDDLTGRTYGQWTVVTRAPDRERPSGNPYRMWACQCSCGVLKAVSQHTLKSGRSTRCWKCSLPSRRKATGPRGAYAKDGYKSGTLDCMRSYKRDAKRRGHAFDLTVEEFDALIGSPCGYCGLPPRNRLKQYYYVFLFSGIDRRDNAIGYTADNCVPCCRTCNYAKHTTSHAEFIAYLDRIVNFRRAAKS